VKRWGLCLNSDQADYFEAVCDFQWRNTRPSITRSTIRYLPVVELLRHLLEEHGMGESDMGRLLGDRSLGHMYSHRPARTQLKVSTSPYASWPTISPSIPAHCSDSLAAPMGEGAKGLKGANVRRVR
jgi:hypothetical protein